MYAQMRIKKRIYLSFLPARTHETWLRDKTIRERETKKREMEASFVAMSPQSQDNYIKRLKTMKSTAPGVENDDPTSSSPI